MSRKLRLKILTLAAAATVCALARAQMVGPQLIARASAPAPMNFSSANFAATATPSLVPSSSNFASAAALPRVSSQFESIFGVPCRSASAAGTTSGPEVDADAADGQREPCVQAPHAINYARFLDAPTAFPLTPKQKAWLAVHDVKDPGNLATIFNAAAFTVALDPHTGFGPGGGGLARASMYSLSEDATLEFFSTFVVSSLTHEDPRYHRMPGAGAPRRLLHALAHTIISQSDSGRTIPNFAALSAYPISAALANLYVPGLETDARSTTGRILTAYATDPVDNIISEFLPDLAHRIHVRAIFAQRVLNQISSDNFVLP